MPSGLDAYGRIVAALADDQPDGAVALSALSHVEAVRRALDSAERDLIQAARTAGAGWAPIAAALGLRSRQAAEQRWLRLSGDSSRAPERARSARARQRIVDAEAGEPIRRLRAAVIATARHIHREDGWDARHPRAALIRSSLELAGDAPASALYALTDKAFADLEVMAAEDRSDSVRRVLETVRDALAAVRPG